MNTKGGDDVPKSRHDVDYGPAWNSAVAEFGNPLGGEPTHSGVPTFERPDEVYGPFSDDRDWAVRESGELDVQTDEVAEASKS